MTCSRYFGTPLYTGTPAVYIIGNGNIITGNHLYFIQGYGIYVTGGDRNSITGNTIVRFGLVNEATCRAIYVDSTCTSTMVGGNTIDGYDLPNTQGYLDLGTSTANYNNSISRTSAG
jgi:parallel beta-helix repeat protein